jgi:hypothetical protein
MMSIRFTIHDVIPTFSSSIYYSFKQALYGFDFTVLLAFGPWWLLFTCLPSLEGCVLLLSRLDQERKCGEA